MDTHQWAQLFYPTAEGNYYLAADGTWIDIPNRPEEELEEGKIYTLDMEYSDEQGYHNAQWIVTKSGNLGGANTLIDILKYFESHGGQSE